MSESHLEAVSLQRTPKVFGRAPHGSRTSSALRGRSRPPCSRRPWYERFVLSCACTLPLCVPEAALVKVDNIVQWFRREERPAGAAAAASAPAASAAAPEPAPKPARAKRQTLRERLRYKVSQREHMYVSSSILRPTQGPRAAEDEAGLAQKARGLHLSTFIKHKTAAAGPTKDFSLHTHQRDCAAEYAPSQHLSLALYLARTPGV